MKKLMFLIVSLALLFGFSSAQVRAQGRCTREQAVEWHTAVAMAVFYRDTAAFDATIALADKPGQLDFRLYQIWKNYEAEITKAVTSLPDKCLIELITVEDRNNQCERFHKAALASVENRMNSLGQESVQNSTREFLTPRMREIIRIMLDSVPQECWFQPVQTPPLSASQAPQPCPQEWAAYDQCNRTNRNSIVMGPGGAGVIRTYVSPCFRPACPR